MPSTQLVAKGVEQEQKKSRGKHQVLYRYIHETPRLALLKATYTAPTVELGRKSVRAVGMHSTTEERSTFGLERFLDDGSSQPQIVLNLKSSKFQ